MKILCLSYEYPPLGGGGSIICQGLATALSKCGNQVDILTSGCKSLPAYECQNGISIYRTRCIRRDISHTNSFELATVLYPMFAKACELVSKNSYDINHTHFIIPTGVVSHWLYHKTGLPYVITIHGSDVPGYNKDRFTLEHKLVAPYWKRIINRSSGIISPSIALKQLLPQKMYVPVTVIPNGFSPSPGDIDFESKEDIVLVVTRMFERKGVQYLLEAIRDINTHWEFVIVGDGPYLPKIKALAANLKQRISITGCIKGKQLSDLYRRAKIFVFPSVKENFPVVLLEAMDAGCAIITSSDKGCSEAVGQAALKITPRNSQKIRAALNHLLNNDEEIKRLSNLARQRIRQLAWPKIACQTKNLFEKVLTSGNL